MDAAHAANCIQHMQRMDAAHSTHGTAHGSAHGAHSTVNAREHEEQTTCFHVREPPHFARVVTKCAATPRCQSRNPRPPARRRCTPACQRRPGCGRCGRCEGGVWVVQIADGGDSHHIVSFVRGELCCREE
eukprot:363883-Chlamydomonas_euryale.AAC.9